MHLETILALVMKFLCLGTSTNYGNFSSGAQPMCPDILAHVKFSADLYWYQ